MSEYSDNGFSVQWIIHFQCFHYLRHVYIKEFSAFCIQTNDYFTYYVKSAPALLHEITQNETEIYERQILKHGFKWGDNKPYTYPFIYHIDKISHQVFCNKISACGQGHSHDHCAEKQLHEKVL